MKRIFGIGTLALIAAVSAAILAQAAAGGRPAVASGSEPVAPIVGRWQQAHTCQELVDALSAQGLAATAPAMVGDYFPDQSYDELAAKDDLCSGAKPQQHSHFFTASGLFGSVDQYGNQVDDGTYVIVDSNTIQIGDGTFDYSIHGGALQLTPRITDRQWREALRYPERFSTAGWMVAVSYPGTKWKKVPCQGWC
jgi:hypothetical protein